MWFAVSHADVPECGWFDSAPRTIPLTGPFRKLSGKHVYHYHPSDHLRL